MKKFLFLSIIMSLIVTFSFAQNVGINADGSLPDASSMLDVKNPAGIGKGFLMPRMNTILRTGILLPADGLQVYDTDTQTIWYFKEGVGWTELSGFSLPYLASINLSNSFPGAAFHIINTSPASGGSGSFEIDNATNGGSALSAISNGGGNAIRAEVTANGATALFARTTGTSMGAAGSFVNDNAANTNVTVGIFTNGTNNNAHALKTRTTGGGKAASFEVNSTTNNTAGVEIFSNGALPSRALRVYHYGLGGTADFEIFNPANVSNVLFINHLGLGRGALIQSTNSGNSQNIFETYTAGTGSSLTAQNAGTSGRAANFTISQATNASNVLESNTSGLGRAGDFSINNAANSNSAIFATTLGTGNALRAEVSSNTFATAVFGRATGSSLGAAGLFVNDNAANTNVGVNLITNAVDVNAHALNVLTTGGARSATFEVNNAANASSGFDIRSNGSLLSRALKVTHTGLGGATDFQIQNGANVNNVLFIDHLGLGRGALIQSTNNNNNSNILDVYTDGGGIAIHGENGNSLGNGSAGVFEKAIAYSDPYTPAVAADLEVRHPFVGTLGLSGLRLFNTAGNNQSWTLYTNNGSGDLSLFYLDNPIGDFSSATGAYTATSDQRVKSNIDHMPDLLSKVMQLQPKTYNYNFDKTHKKVLGFLAQEVEPLFPQIIYKNVNDNKDDLYRMDYSGFGVIAIKAIQEQQKIIQLQRNDIEQLKHQVAELTVAVNKLLHK